MAAEIVFVGGMSTLLDRRFGERSSIFRELHGLISSSILQVLKDGMQHIGKLFCSSLGAKMDSEPKRWRVFGTALDDI
jgi:hypothetical protein